MPVPPEDRVGAPARPRPAGTSTPCLLPADEGGEISVGDEGALAVDNGLHPRPDIADDVRPGISRLLLVEAAPAGHVVGRHPGVADHHRWPARRAPPGFRAAAPAQLR